MASPKQQNRFYPGRTLSNHRILHQNQVAHILKHYPELHFEVGGHTDSIGEPERNKTVSEQRAAAVKNFFIEQGIVPDTLKSAGYGPEHPIGDNATAAGRAANRRVELTIIHPE